MKKYWPHVVLIVIVLGFIGMCKSNHDFIERERAVKQPLKTFQDTYNDSDWIDIYEMCALFSVKYGIDSADVIGVYLNYIKLHKFDRYAYILVAILKPIKAFTTTFRAMVCFPCTLFSCNSLVFIVFILTITAPN